MHTWFTQPAFSLGLNQNTLHIHSILFNIPYDCILTLTYLKVVS